MEDKLLGVSSDALCVTGGCLEIAAEKASGRHWALLRVRAVDREGKQRECSWSLLRDGGRSKFLQAVSKLILEVVRQGFMSK